MVTTTVPPTPHRVRARHMWQVILVVFAVATIAANIAYGALSHNELSDRIISGLIHALPPLAFLLLVEALLLTAKSGIFGWLYRTLLIGAVIAAIVAFSTSYFSLLALSREHGHMPYPQLDYALPVLFDLVMGLATVAVFGLGEKPVKRTPKPAAAPAPQRKRKGLVPVLRDALLADPDAAVPVPQATAPAPHAVPHPVPQCVPHSAPTVQPTVSAPAPQPERTPASVPTARATQPVAHPQREISAHLRTIADAVHADRIARKLTADDIAVVLADDEAGVAVTTIAKTRSVHRDTVYNVLEAARRHRRFAAVN
jgi:hypothetical protein